MTSLLQGVEWARPGALWLLLSVPLLLLATALERRRAPRLRFPRAAALRAFRGTLARLAWLPAALLALALGLTALALARPQSRIAGPEEIAVEGIDIVVALDLSTSMRALDFEPVNRITVAKQVLRDFVSRRTHDRIGLVVFALDAYTQAPLTLDTAALRRLVDEIEIGRIEDGTAIGNAIATAANRLRESDARSKVVILITDGDNNAGQVAPLEAARAAAALGIRVFTILVGKGGQVPYPDGEDLLGRAVTRQVELPVNPDLLRRIAAETGGTAVNATDKASLVKGLDDILDRLERSRLVAVRAVERREELFPVLLLPAFALAAAALLLGSTRLRPFP
jgi:Ca-activated chloride channel family protein